MTTDDAHPLARLAAALADGPDARLLPEGQLLISRGIVPTRAGGKAASTEPGPDGFRIYVSVRSPGQHAAMQATRQRFSVPGDPVRWHPAGRMRATEDNPDPEWTVTNGRGEVVVVRVGTGSATVLDEVNSILDLIRSAVLV